MESLSDVYKYLSGVDITKINMADERGKGYYGEFQVFCELFEHLPSPSKMLMNIHVPTSNGKTTEIDLIAITPVGIIIYEVKNYKGTIYGSGDGQIWTQFFKTAPNQTFQNPIIQNAYHCNAIYKETGIPTYSVVVFTNYDCDLRLDNITVPVCKLYDVVGITKNVMSTAPITYTADDIERVFKKLSSYSSMSTPISPKNNLSFCDWIYEYRDAFIKLYDNYKLSVEKQEYDLKQKNEEEHNRYKGKLKKTLIAGIVTVSVIIALLLSIGIPVISGNKAYFDASLKRIEDNYNYSMDSMKAELEDMENNFKAVEKYDKIPLSSVVEVADLTLQKSADNNTVLSYRLILKDTFYRVDFNSDTCLLVKLKDGTVNKYYAFSESARNLAKAYSLNLINLSHSFDSSLLSGIKPEDISFMKLTNLDLYVTNDVHGYDEIEKKAELLIYNCE